MPIIKRITIVEDDPCLQKLLHHTLKKLGAEMTLTHSVFEAIDHLRNNQTELIILDLNLSDGHGSEILKYLQDNKNSLNHKTPVLVISGSITKELLDNFKEQITQSYPKPIQPTKLLQLIAGIF